MMANEETRTPPSGGLAAGESAPSDNLNNAPSNVLQRLRELPLFAQLSDAEFRQVTDLLRSSETPRGALLIEQGGSNTNLYILRRGRAVIRIVDLQDVEHLAGFLHVGQIFNEAAFLTGARNGQTVEALEPLTLWYIPRETFLALLDENSDLASHLVYPKLPDMQTTQQTRRIRLHAWQRPGEVVLLFRRKHPWFFVRTLWPLPFVAVLVLLLLLPPVNTFVNALLPIILGGVSLVVAAYVLLRFIDWHNDYYAITDQRVIHRERVLLIHDEQDEVPLNKIQDVTVDRPSFFSLMIDFGDVMIESMGTRSKVRFRDIGKPDQVGEVIFEQLQRTRVESHASQRAKIRADLRRELGLGSNAPGGGGGVRKLHTPPRIMKRMQQYGTSLRSLRNTILPRMRLDEGGTITYRKHWLRLLQTISLPSTCLLLYIALLGIISLSSSDLGRLLFSLPMAVLVIAAGLVLIGWWVYRYEDWRNDIYILASDRIVDIDRSPFGLRGTSRREAKLSAVQNVTYKTLGFVDVAFNMGDVIIQTAGGEGTLTFERVYDPRHVQRDIVDRIEAYDTATRENQAAQRRREMTEWLGIYDELTQLHERRKPG